MGVIDKIRASNGVVNFFNKHGDKLTLGKPKRKSARAQEEHLNNILIRFGKDNNISMLKNNSPKYEGSHGPFLDNCYRVQENWNLFVNWLFKKYSIDEKESNN